MSDKFFIKKGYRKYSKAYQKKAKTSQRKCELNGYPMITVEKKDLTQGNSYKIKLRGEYHGICWEFISYLIDTEMNTKFTDIEKKLIYLFNKI